MKVHEWTVQVADLQALQEGLETVLTHLKAADISNATKNLAPEVNYSPLTVEVDNLLLKITGYIEEVAIEEYDSERRVTVPDDTDEEDDGLAGDN